MTFGISGSDYRFRPKTQTLYSWSAVPVPVSFGYYAEIVHLARHSWNCRRGLHGQRTLSGLKRRANGTSKSTTISFFFP